MEKTIIESKRTSKDHIKVRLKMVCLYLLNVLLSETAVFKNSNATHKDDNVQHSSLKDMVGKAEMRVNRQLFWQEGNDFRMRVTPALCRWVDLTDKILGLGEQVFQKLRLRLKESFLKFHLTAELNKFSYM